MSALIRMMVSVFGSIFVTFGILFLMHMLIKTDFDKPVESDLNREVMVRKFQEMPPPPTLQNVMRPKISPAPGLPAFKPEIHQGETTAINYKFDTKSHNAIRPGRPLDNTDVTAIFIPTPSYPGSAERSAVEGFAVIEFTVTPDGKTAEVKLITESPTGYGFGRSAIKAAERFHFNPRIVDGMKVSTTQVRHAFNFFMADN